MGSETNVPLLPVSKIADIVLGGTPRRDEPSFWGGTIKWASAKDIASCSVRYIYDTEEKITGNGINNSNTKVLTKDTIVITARGTVGAMALLGEPMAFNQSCYGIKAKEGVESKYLYYALKASMSSINSISYGTVFNTITMKSFDSIKVPIPSLSEQKRIAHILGTLDDKIELNQRMNETLEAMARALFKAWFVDFEPVKAKMNGEPYPLPDEIMELFPYELMESELGLIPKGWKVGMIDDFGKIVCGKTPPKSNKAYFGGEIPFIKIPDMHNNVFITTTGDSLTILGADSQRNKYLPPFSIIISSIATVGLVAITSKTSQTNQQINAIVPNDINKCYYIYFFSKTISNYLKVIGSSGSATLNVNTTELKRINCLIPTDSLTLAFNELVKSILLLILKNTEVDSLYKVRNLLLDELIRCIR